MPISWHFLTAIQPYFSFFFGAKKLAFFTLYFSNKTEDSISIAFKKIFKIPYSYLRKNQVKINYDNVEITSQ